MLLQFRKTVSQRQRGHGQECLHECVATAWYPEERLLRYAPLF